MPIGNGPDYYNGNNREEDERIKTQDMVEKWWRTLDDNYKYELLAPDEAWNELDWNDKWNIYTEENDKRR